LHCYINNLLAFHYSAITDYNAYNQVSDEGSLSWIIVWDDYPVARAGIPRYDNSLFQLSSSLPISPAIPL
jgi:hypothetical protein